jgi:hypothetical protein
VQKYRSQSDKFVVVTVNMSPSEDSFVPSIMRRGNYTFMTLRVPSEDWADLTFGFTFEPVNFLLDHQGRVLYREGEEDQIDELLARAAANNSAKTTGKQ